jgi:putative ABC transport system ATP-binding protein
VLREFTNIILPVFSAVVPALQKMGTSDYESHIVVEESDPNAPFLQLSNLVKVYPSAQGGVTALKGVSAEVGRGEFVGVLGRSGAGKSTLINMLTGVDKLNEGEIWMEGTPVHALNEDQVAFWRGRKVGVIYQSFELMPSLSLLDNVMLPMDFCDLYRRGESRERAMDLLRQVELQDHALKLPSAISGGQQQRVAIARALANDPPLIIADEPTGSLDSATAEIIIELFEGLVKEGKTIIMATHDHSMDERFTHTITLDDGILAEEKHAEQPEAQHA